jgi:hypothetical protein
MTCGVVVVELRGFEPLTPCMPSRDPHHSAHHKPSRSRALQQSKKASAWWFVRFRRAELLRACCAKQGDLWARRSLVQRLVGSRPADLQQRGRGGGSWFQTDGRTVASHGSLGVRYRILTNGVARRALAGVPTRFVVTRRCSGTLTARNRAALTLRRFPVGPAGRLRELTTTLGLDVARISGCLDAGVV